MLHIFFPVETKKICAKPATKMGRRSGIGIIGAAHLNLPVAAGLKPEN